MTSCRQSLGPGLDENRSAIIMNMVASKTMMVDRVIGASI